LGGFSSVHQNSELYDQIFSGAYQNPLNKPHTFYCYHSLAQRHHYLPQGRTLSTCPYHHHHLSAPSRGAVIITARGRKTKGSAIAKSAHAQSVVSEVGRTAGKQKAVGGKQKAARVVGRTAGKTKGGTQSCASGENARVQVRVRKIGEQPLLFKFAKSASI
jgi:hypothetical protein